MVFFLGVLVGIMIALVAKMMGSKEDSNEKK